MLKKIAIRPNVPVDLALQYLEGKPVNGSSMFSTIDNRALFVPLAGAQEIQMQLRQLGIRRGERILVEQSQVRNGQAVENKWKVYRTEQPVGEQADGTFVVPAPVGVREPTDESKPNLSQKPAGPAPQSIDSITASLLDTYVQALEYARERYGDRITPADVRALVIAAHMGRGKR